MQCGSMIRLVSKSAAALVVCRPTWLRVEAAGRQQDADSPMQHGAVTCTPSVSAPSRLVRAPSPTADCETVLERSATRSPLLGGQVERRSPVNFRDDDAAAWNYVGRITRVPGRGGDAKVVLEVQVRLAQPVVIRETGGHQGSIVRPVAAKQPSIRWGRYWIFLSLRSVFILPTVHRWSPANPCASGLSSARPPAAQTTAG